MYLRKLGYAVDQRAVFDRTGLDPRLGAGAYTAELKRAIDAFGFRSGPVWFKVRAANAARRARTATSRRCTPTSRAA
jgi:hypothetical protein